jgi:PAS domain S-box-containing protein
VLSSDDIDKQREVLELAMDVAEIGTWTWDIAGGPGDWDQRARRIFCLPQDSPPSYELFYSMVHPEDQPLLGEANARAIKPGGKDYAVEYRIIRPDGQVRWISSRGRVVRDETGRAIRVNGVCSDVTARKLAEDALRDSEQRYRKLATDRKYLDELSERLRSHDDIEELIYDAACMTGKYLGATGCGMTEIDLENDRFLIMKDFHADGCPSVQGQRPINQYMMRGITGYFEGRAMIVQDTHVHPATSDRVQASYGPLNVRAFVSVPVARHGKLVSAFWVNSSVPRAWSEEDVALIRLAGERTWAAVERVRLMAAERAARLAAEHASRAKDQFIAVLSHELRTPLNPVLATITAMEMDETIPPMARGELSMVRRNVELEARLIDDLLDLTRIARGKMELRRQVVDGHRLLEHVVEICAPELQEKSLTLTVQLAASEHHVHADPARLQQIFWNLLKNAIKFTGPQGKIAVRTHDRDGNFVLSVTDSGIGIPANALTRIFDAFEQASPDINRRFGGLGLGLAISKALVDAHGGTLSANSAGAGHGATFTLSLPHVAPEPAPKTRAAPSRRTPPLRILLVEDHYDTARVMARLLGNFGHDVVPARSVSEAKAMLSEKSFDLVLSDLGLPDASGHELMRHVRANYPRLAGIAISGYGTDDDIQKSLEAGFVEHVTKPVNIQTLEAMLGRIGRASGS